MTAVGPGTNRSTGGPPSTISRPSAPAAPATSCCRSRRSTGGTDSPSCSPTSRRRVPAGAPGRTRRRLRPRRQLIQARALDPTPGTRVRVVGTYAADRTGPPPQLLTELGSSTRLTVDQTWAPTRDRGNDHVEVAAAVEREDADYVVYIRDDAILPSRFLDTLVATQATLDVDRLQPAHTSGPTGGPPVTERHFGTVAREIDAVTALPVLSVRAARSAHGPVTLADNVTVGLRRPLERAAAAAGFVRRTWIAGPDLRPVVTERPEPAVAPRISVLIATYNRPELLRACLESFARRRPSTGPSTRSSSSTTAPTTTPRRRARRARRPSSQVIGLRIAHARPQRSQEPRGVPRAGADRAVLRRRRPRRARLPRAAPRRATRAKPGEAVAILGHTDWAPELELTPLMHYITDVDRLMFAYERLGDGQELDWRGFWEGRISCKRVAARAPRPARPTARLLDRRRDGLAPRAGRPARHLRLVGPQPHGPADRLRRVLRPHRGEGQGARDHRRAPSRHGDGDAAPARRRGEALGGASASPSRPAPPRRRARSPQPRPTRPCSPSCTRRTGRRSACCTPRASAGATEGAHRHVRACRRPCSRSRTPIPDLVYDGTPAGTGRRAAAQHHASRCGAARPSSPRWRGAPSSGSGRSPAIPTEVVVVDNGSPYEVPLRGEGVPLPGEQGRRDRLEHRRPPVDRARGRGAQQRLPRSSRVGTWRCTKPRRRPARRVPVHRPLRRARLREPRSGRHRGLVLHVRRRTLYDEVGVFDEWFNPAFCEDTDYWHRAWQMGIELSPVPAARVVHARRTTASTDARVDMLLQGHRYKYGWKHGVDPHRAPPYYNREIIDYVGTFRVPDRVHDRAARSAPRLRDRSQQDRRPRRCTRR